MFFVFFLVTIFLLIMITLKVFSITVTMICLLIGAVISFIAWRQDIQEKKRKEALRQRQIERLNRWDEVYVSRSQRSKSM